MSAHRDVLVRAREILAERGWCQWHEVTSDGVCSLHAIGIACRELGHDDWGPAYMDARECLTKVIGTHSVRTWNDAKDRKREQVLDAFARAAEVAS